MKMSIIVIVPQDALNRFVGLLAKSLSSGSMVHAAAKEK